jgi:hypothetical protein
MMPIKRRSVLGRGEASARTPRHSIKLPEAPGEGHQAQPTQPNRLSVERIRQSIAAEEYLTFRKIDVTVDCIYRELFGL